MPIGGVQPNLKDIPDEVVEEFIQQHPSGASYEAIGEVMGLTRTRVAQIVAQAMQKALRAAVRRGVVPSDFPTKSTTWDRLETG